jgi:NADH-quinone oxidoreductase subunit G
MNTSLFNVLAPFSSNLNILQLGLLPGVNFYNAFKTGLPSKKVYYLLGADDFCSSSEASNSFFIYQGHHGDKIAKRSDVILPGFSFFEKTSTYLNLQGFAQLTNSVILPSKGQLRSD